MHSAVSQPLPHVIHDCRWGNIITYMGVEQTVGQATLSSFGIPSNHYYCEQVYCISIYVYYAAGVVPKHLPSFSV